MIRRESGRCWAALVLAILLIGAGRGTAQGPGIPQLIAAQLDSIQTIELEYDTYYADLKGPEVIVGEGGAGLFAHWTWGWDRSTERQYLKGRRALDFKEAGGKFIYQEEQYAFDGKEFRTCLPRGKSGTIMPPSDMRERGTFELFRGPMHLIGYQLAINGRAENLGELLVRERDRWQVAQGADANLWTLTLPLPSDSPDAQARVCKDQALDVNVDGSRGFIPIKIVLRNPHLDQVFFTARVDEAVEVAPGIWLPIVGAVGQFYIDDVTPPPGLTEDMLKTITAEEYLKILRDAKFTIKSLGLGDTLYRVDKESIHVNHQINPDRFTISFPDGYTVWNGFEGKAVTFGAVEPEKPPVVERLGSTGWFVLLNALIIGILLLLAAFYFARRARAAHL